MSALSALSAEKRAEIESQISDVEDRMPNQKGIDHLKNSKYGKALAALLANETLNKNFRLCIGTQGRAGKTFVKMVVGGTIESELVDARGGPLNGRTRSKVLKDLKEIAAVLGQQPRDVQAKIFAWLEQGPLPWDKDKYDDNAPAIQLARLYTRTPQLLPWSDRNNDAGPPPGTTAMTFGGLGGGDLPTYLSHLVVGGLGGAPVGPPEAPPPGPGTDTGLTPAVRTMVQAHTLAFQEQVRAVPGVAGQVAQQVTRESGNTLHKLGANYIERIAGIVNNPNDSSGAAVAIGNSG